MHAFRHSLASLRISFFFVAPVRAQLLLFYFHYYLFLVQSFFETLQYCDEWRKFTSVSQSVSQSVSESVSHSVNSGGLCKFRTRCLNVILTRF